MAVELVPQEPAEIKASPRRFALHALWRLTAWGSAAAVALAVVAFATQTEIGSRRLAALALADLPVRPIATVQIPKQEAQVARLEAQVRTLAVDRDRLAERVANLEQNIEDITGSIKRQAAQVPPPAMPPILSMVPAPNAPQSAVAPVKSTTDVKQIDKLEPTQKINAATLEQAQRSDAVPQPIPEIATESAHGNVPLPSARVAALPAVPAPLPAKPEFGVALASSSSLDVLNLQWTALKANYGPLLAGLRPIATREQSGTATQYRLVLGPFPSYAAAAHLCMRLTAARAICHPGKFAGEPL